MWGALRQIRPGERRDTFVAAASLFVLLGAHAILETARDALFLASIAPEQLPVVYIGVAVAALAVSAIQDRGPSGRAALAGWLVLSGAVTAGFFALIETGEWVLYALYVWSAVVVTVALTRFFLLLGERFDVGQAKRLYATIGAGSVLGAIAGSGVAGLLATRIEARELLLVGAGTLGLAALGPLALSSTAPAPGERNEAERLSPVDAATSVLLHPYARRVAALMVLATLTFTFVDFVFKSEVAREVAAADLGVFFARVYFVLNVLSLAVQLLAVRWVIRVGDPTRALAILPAMLALGGLGVLLGGGIVAGLGLKGADGALRHSLHRTASELLYVPMTRSLRTASKTFIDIAAHRGGQAIASVAILGVTAAGLNPDYLGAAIFALAGGAVAISIGLRKHYLGVFRATLAEVAERKEYAFPELNLATLESLLAALNSADPRRVEVALDLFAEQGRARLIPGLILYHPDPDVLAKALALLADTGRTDFLELADRLLDHEYAHVRAAALRARMKLAPDEALLRGRLEIACPVVRATALVGLTSGGYATLRETQPYLDDVVAKGSPVAREALARAIGYGQPALHDDFLIALARCPEQEVLASVVRSMAEAPSMRFIPSLVRMLPRRRIRGDAARVLVQLGQPALDVLEQTLIDPDEPPALRRQIPRVIARFEPRRAAEILVSHLTDCDDGGVRYRILRALNRLVADHPDVRLDRAHLSRALEQNVRRSYELLAWSIVLERGAEGHEGRQTSAHDLLRRMLRDKQENARERLFRLLGVLHPRQDLPTIFRGLESAQADVRASSRELLESFVDPSLRDPLLALVDDLPDEDRLRAGASVYAPRELDYVSLLRTLIDTASDSLRSLAVYHVGELGLSELSAQVDALEPSPDSALEVVVRQARAALGLEVAR